MIKELTIQDARYFSYNPQHIEEQSRTTVMCFVISRSSRFEHIKREKTLAVIDKIAFDILFTALKELPNLKIISKEKFWVCNNQINRKLDSTFSEGSLNCAAMNANEIMNQIFSRPQFDFSNVPIYLAIGLNHINLFTYCSTDLENKKKNTVTCDIRIKHMTGAMCERVKIEKRAFNSFFDILSMYSHAERDMPATSFKAHIITVDDLKTTPIHFILSRIFVPGLFFDL